MACRTYNHSSHLTLKTSQGSELHVLAGIWRIVESEVPGKVPPAPLCTLNQLTYSSFCPERICSMNASNAAGRLRRISRHAIIINRLYLLADTLWLLDKNSLISSRWRRKATTVSAIYHKMSSRMSDTFCSEPTTDLSYVQDRRI